MLRPLNKVITPNTIWQIKTNNSTNRGLYNNVIFFLKILKAKSKTYKKIK